ncbi:uncharacterized protein LOC126594931 [Malus sylvestris]|nr:uncharacterized protein LOC126594931 [Malus sylvestris]
MARRLRSDHISCKMIRFCIPSTETSNSTSSSTTTISRTIWRRNHLSSMAMGNVPGAEARGKLRCPGMIDCSSVCEGFPWRCVNGECICDGGNAPPQLQHEANFLPNQLP